jgi:vitamin B12 transporter
MNKWYAMGLGLISSGFAAAQSVSDSLSLQAVTVESTRFTQFNTGSKSSSTDSILSIPFRTQNLSDLLASQSQVFIKSYGPSLATASFRGSSATQTAVLWKGFNIQNPMLGEVDFSLVAGDVADEVSVLYGGNGALFGSGAVGGTVLLQSSPLYRTGLHANVGAQVGSFGHFRKQAGVRYGGSKWFGNLKVFQLLAQNDFTYTNTFLPNQPKVKLTNAVVKQQGLVIEQYFQLTPNQELSINFWYQQSNREIPPSMSVPVTQANQRDETYRTTAEWKLTQKQVIWMLRSAYFDERINYVNPLSTLLSGDSRSRTQISEAEANWNVVPKQSINIGFNNTYTSAFADGYGGTFDRNRTALFVSYKTNEWVKRLITTISLRQEWVKGSGIPIMPSLGAEWKTTTWLSVFGNVSRSYRLPTFNELYWKSVTTQVKPESGWGEELNLKANGSYKKVAANLTVGVFNRTIQNWIVWQPAAIDWAPQNIKQVWSRGVELDMNIGYMFKRFNLTYHGMVNYVLSTNRETATANDVSVGKQLIYVPRITHQHQVLAAFHSWHLGILQNYIGLRFTTTDNLDWLDDYALTSVVAGKQFRIRAFVLVLTAQCYNLWNTSYQAIADRPMPGRNFLLNTTLKF